LIVGPGQIHIELDGLKIIPLENVYWNDNNNSFSCSINKMQKDSLEQVQLILHRYIKLFFILSVILLLIVVRVQHLFQNQFGLLIDRS
jgi:hypothetical protein